MRQIITIKGPPVPKRLPFFIYSPTNAGKRVAESLCAEGRPFSQKLEARMFTMLDGEFWSAAPRERPVGCLLELALKGPAVSDDQILELEMAAERMEAHGVAVFLFSTAAEVPADWVQRPFLNHYHFMNLSLLDERSLDACEETMVLHLHFARFLNESEVQVYEPSAIKFLRTRQRLEQECFVMSGAENSAVRSDYFVKLLARHSCPEFHAIETERMDGSLADLLDASGVKLRPELPHVLLGHILAALELLHDWSDLGIRTLGDFRRRIGLPLREVIPGSAYFRGFRHVPKEALDAVPFRIVHCDLKPGNFLVKISDSARRKLAENEGEIGPEEIAQVKMADFDLCRYGQPHAESTGSRNGPSYTGTVGYTAPEMFLTAESNADVEVESERRITPLIDFYPLGTIFYELLTRQPLLPEDLMNQEDEELYGVLLDFHRSRGFLERLERIEDAAARAFISACTRPRQEERRQTLRELLGLARTNEVTAAALYRFCTAHGLAAKPS